MDGYTATADTTRVYEQPPAIVQQHVGSASVDSLQLRIFEVLREMRKGAEISRALSEEIARKQALDDSLAVENAVRGIEADSLAGEVQRSQAEVRRNQATSDSLLRLIEKRQATYDSLDGVTKSDSVKAYLRNMDMRRQETIGDFVEGFYGALKSIEGNVRARVRDGVDYRHIQIVTGIKDTYLGVTRFSGTDGQERYEVSLRTPSGSITVYDLNGDEKIGREDSVTTDMPQDKGGNESATTQGSGIGSKNSKRLGKMIERIKKLCWFPLTNPVSNYGSSDVIYTFPTIMSDTNN